MYYDMGTDTADGWQKQFTTLNPTNNWYGITLSIDLQSPVPVIALIVGIVVGLALFILRDRFTWFRLSPAGFVLAAFYGPFMVEIILVGLVLKYLTLKIGGPSLYEKGRSFAMGCMLVMFMLIVLVSVTGNWNELSNNLLQWKAANP
jgi:hypothetical protein